ncbi:unnamed protein product [Urochloa humidicola]
MAVLDPVAATPNPARAHQPGYSLHGEAGDGGAGAGSRTTRARCSAPVTGTTTGALGTTTSEDLSLASPQLGGDFYLARTMMHVTGTAPYPASVWPGVRAGA